MELRILDLSELSAAEVEHEAGDAVTRLERAAPTEEHGDLGLTVVVLVLGSAAIHGLAIWLAKRNVSVKNTDEMSLRLAPDGTIEMKVTKTYQGASSSPPDASIVEALRTDLSAALKALGATV